MKNNHRFKDLAIRGAYAVIAILSYQVGTCIGDFFVKQQKTLEPGYPVPHEVRINYCDLNNDGTHETRLTHKGKSYLLKLDEKKNLVLEAYKINHNKK
ncbi:hypothetical protein KY348_03635 [Candidatus Woesearchaeota archaeon]|nr:hypothetical protein [Candidatus Woesearchaeota archaeon]